MVAGKDVCLRRLAGGMRAREVRFNRFLGNAKVTTTRIIESWSDGTVMAAEGRHERTGCYEVSSCTFLVFKGCLPEVTAIFHPRTMTSRGVGSEFL